MQIKKIVALTALACAALSGQAIAAPTQLTPAQQLVVTDANTNSRILFISGASAVQKGFSSIINTLIPGTKTFFADKNGVDTAGKAISHNYEAVAGVLDTTIGGAWAGQNVIIVYRVEGGSVWGVNPVARGEFIDSLNVTSATCNGGSYASADGSNATDKAFVCSKNTRIPDAGVSDVAPAFFKEPLNTEGEAALPQLNEIELAKLNSTALYSLAFGVPVTNNVTTSLNRSAIAAIMSGAVSTWNQVDPALPADDIVICRRVPGSGTQAVENMYFGNFPCGLSNTPVARDANEAVFNPSEAWTLAAADSVDGKAHAGTGKYTVGGNAGTVVVIENSSSGDVRSCLEKAVSGGKYVTKNRDGSTAEHLVDFGAGGKKAIGVLSMDSLSASAGKPWSFRALDGNGSIAWVSSSSAPTVTNAVGAGRLPTLANLVDGTWDMQGWISFNIPDRIMGDETDLIPADADKMAVLNAFVSKAKDPAVLTSISDLKFVAAAIPDGNNSGNQTLRVEYPLGNQCAPLSRSY